MNPWEVLKIEPTDDKKVIKKAYAALLKQYRPDEFPNEFKEIQEAYRLALLQHGWQFPAQAPSKFGSINKNVVKIKQVNSDGFELSENVVDEEELKHQYQQNQRIENIYKQLHVMAFETLAVKDNIENWQFIEDYYLIDDLQLRWQVARDIFKKVAEYNIYQAKQNKTLLISSMVLKYFDEVFDWSSRWSEYSRFFPEHYFTVTFHYFESKDKFRGVLDLKANVLVRIQGFVIDFFSITLLSTPILMLDVSDFSQSLMIIIVFILVRLTFELKSKKHNTLGKKLNNTITLDEFGNFCSKQSTLLRHLYMNLMLIPVLYLPILEINFKGEWMTLLVVSLILLNLVLIVFGRGFIHDYLSKTLVVKL